MTWGTIVDWFVRNEFIRC